MVLLGVVGRTLTIGKSLLANFDLPSILWGIDGDWMVNYIPKEISFYPTDHCGVLRVKSELINPRYLSWALDKIGQSVRFSRDHRASMTRVKSLTVQLPSLEIQNDLVNKVELLEKKILDARLAL